MAEGLNRVVLIGNLGQDPELRFTQGGQACLNVRMACSEKFKNRDGEYQERTEWVSCVVWGNRGEALSKILGKGSQICVEGRLQTRSWEKDGVKRFSTEVVANNVVLLGSGKGDKKHESYDGPPGYGDDDTDIPF